MNCRNPELLIEYGIQVDEDSKHRCTMELIPGCKKFKLKKAKVDTQEVKREKERLIKNK